MLRVYIVVDHYQQHWVKLSKYYCRFFLTSPQALKLAKLVPNGDFIVDNGVYHYGEPNIKLIVRASKMGLRFVMPDVLADARRTVELHLRWADRVDLSRAFLVLQGTTLDEYLWCLEQYEHYGLTKKTKYIAVGGPKERERHRRVIGKLWSLLRNRYYVHALGFSTYACHSFDTNSPNAWWFGRKYTEESFEAFVRFVLDYVRRWDGQRGLDSFLE